MFTRKIAIGLILSATAFLPAISQAGGPPAQADRSVAAQAPCVLKQYKLSSVTRTASKKISVGTSSTSVSPGPSSMCRRNRD
jgi:hypothetical protein